jgi:hypothetical protein
MMPPRSPAMEMPSATVARSTHVLYRTFSAIASIAHEHL